MSGIRSTGSAWRLAFAMVVAVSAMAACVTAQATPSAQIHGPTSSAEASAATPTAPPTPTFGPAPSGDWTSLNWIRVEGSLAAGYPEIVPSVTKPLEGATIQTEGPNVYLRGVNHGYLQLLWDPYQRTLTPWLSADARSWRKGSSFDLAAWKADFAKWDKLATDDVSRSGCGLFVDDFAVGAAGIVVRAHFECESSCGASYVSVQAMWTSPDGLAWTALASSGFGKTGIGRIAGGANGFIGLALNRKATWTSIDGRSWRQGAVPADAYSVTDPISIQGGFVIGGVVVTRNGKPISPEPGKCGLIEYVNGGRYTATTWWSKDGVTWQRQQLSATTGDRVEMDVRRIDDHTVLATQTTYGPDALPASNRFWVSRDGRAWTDVQVPWTPDAGWSTIEGDRGLLTWYDGQADHYCAIGRDGSPRELTQTGDLPPSGVQEFDAIGPDGLLVTDGTTFWLGIPSAG